MNMRTTVNTCVYMTRRTRREAGFSLIEVMISLVILAFGVLALTDLQLTVTKGNGSSSTMVTAISLAEQKMESLKTASYTTIQSEPPTAVTASGGTYTRQVIVTSNQPMLNVKTVQVIVSGADGQRTLRCRSPPSLPNSARMKTLKSETAF